jgi:hypothetical protein
LGALSLLLILPAGAAAQKVQLTPFVGYRVFGSYEGYYGGDYDVKDALAYGGILGFSPNPWTGVEFVYSHQGTDLEYRPIGGSLETYQFNVDQWALNGYRNLGQSGSRVQPFLGAGAGLTSFYSDDIQGSEQRFTMNFDLGLKAWAPSERVALRLDARGYVTFAGNGGGGGGCGTGGCYMAVSGNVFFQGELTAGLTIGLGH